MLASVSASESGSGSETDAIGMGELDWTGGCVLFLFCGVDVLEREVGYTLFLCYWESFFYGLFRGAWMDGCRVGRQGRVTVTGPRACVIGGASESL